MLRKTLIALTAVGALGVSSAAIAAGQGQGAGGGGGGGASPSFSGGGGGGGGASPSFSGGGRGGGGRGGMAAMPSGAGPSGHLNASPRGPSNFSTRSNFISPRGNLSTQSNTWSGKNTWKGANWDGGRRHHHRFRNSAFIGVGFGAGFYGGYDSCWRLVPTYWGGWRRVWVCDYDYPYWGY